MRSKVSFVNIITDNCTFFHRIYSGFSKSGYIWAGTSPCCISSVWSWFAQNVIIVGINEYVSYVHCAWMSIDTLIEWHIYERCWIKLSMINYYIYISSLEWLWICEWLHKQFFIYNLWPIWYPCFVKDIFTPKVPSLWNNFF
jgi:hypothetical protein